MSMCLHVLRKQNRPYPGRLSCESILGQLLARQVIWVLSRQDWRASYETVCMSQPGITQVCLQGYSKSRHAVNLRHSLQILRLAACCY